jgi:hypothetical protein
MSNEYLLTMLPTEITHHKYDAAITVATFFTGEAPIEFLKDRLQKILHANVWLASRLHASEKGSVCLKIPSEPSLSPFYHHINIKDVCQSGGGIGALMQEVNAPVLSEKCTELFTKQGFKSLDKDEPLFKVRLCIGDDGMFVLLVSMSHVIGDGATLYSIYRMLAPQAPVVTMNPERLLNFHKTLTESGCVSGSCWLPRDGIVSDNKKFNWLLNSKALRSTRQSRLVAGLSEPISCDDGDERPDSFSGGLFQVNLDWVRAQKDNFIPKNDVSWISTNDVISSWFMNTCKPDLGVIAIDARGHIDQLTDEHAGNYQVGFLYTPSEYKTPTHIRRSIANFPSACNSNEDFGTKETVALITNWSKFYTELNFDTNCQLVVHFPLVPPELNTPSLVDSTMIVFCPREGELAAALGVDKIERFFENDVLGASLFPPS